MPRPRITSSLSAPCAIALALAFAGCAGGGKAQRGHPAPEGGHSAPEGGHSAPEAVREASIVCGRSGSHRGTLDVPRSLLEGEASWYGKRHHGKLTASGEPFDMYKPSAAHPTLRLGTRVRVTNLGNDRSIELCVNDRGPYSGGRVLDVSYAAAEALGFIEVGHAPVRIEILGR